MKRIIILGIICIFLILSLGSATRESLTYDEPVHIGEGLAAWTKHEFLVDVVNPPFIREIAVLPFILGISKNDTAPPNMTYLPARMMILILGVLAFVVLWKYGSTHTGGSVMTFALLLLSLEPNILAHSHYATLDFGYSVFLVIAYIAFLLYRNAKSIKQLVVFSICTALAASSKVSAIPVLVISISLLMFYEAGITKKYQARQLFSIKRICIFGIIILTTVWSVYFFKSDTIIVERQDAGRVSEKLLVYARNHNVPILATLITLGKTTPVPLGNYMAVLKNSFLLGKQQGASVFFAGSLHTKNMWYFLPVNLLLKLPIPLLLLFFAGIFVFVRQKSSRSSLIPWMVPIVAIFCAAWMGSVHPLIRYILPVIFFVVVISGFGAKYLVDRGYKVIVGVLFFGMALSASHSYPHFLSYANIMAGDLVTQSKFFTDSNIDWGQSLPDVYPFMQKRNISSLQFSYFGRDDGSKYGLLGADNWSSYKYDDICAFKFVGDKEIVRTAKIISISNWHSCGYSDKPEYSSAKINDIIGNSLLFFDK